MRSGEGRRKGRGSTMSGLCRWNKWRHRYIKRLKSNMKRILSFHRSYKRDRSSIRSKCCIIEWIWMRSNCTSWGTRSRKCLLNSQNQTDCFWYLRTIIASLWWNSRHRSWFKWGGRVRWMAMISNISRVYATITSIAIALNRILHRKGWGFNTHRLLIRFLKRITK